MFAGDRRRLFGSGFTIVELLVVIVVIGVLAAITIVAYTGITKRAAAASLQSDLENASKLLKLDLVTDGSFPTVLNLANGGKGIPFSSGNSYQYTVDNTVNPPKFCITATNGSQSYKIDQDNQPSVGGCPGHSQGGVVAITNLVSNPSFEVNTSGWTLNTPGTTTLGSIGLISPAQSGLKAMRYTVTTAGTLSNFGPFISVPGLSESKSYVLSAYVRSNKSFNYSIYAERRNSSGVNIGNLSSSSNLVANSWTKVILVVPATPSMTQLTFCVYGGGVTLSVGDYIDYDSAMAYEGPTVAAYYDGNSSNWVWNGTVNNSTSTGPAL